MVILRATRKVQRYLKVTADAAGSSDTALGDWYVNRVVVDRQPLLLLVSEKSLLPLVIRAKNVATLPTRLPDLVADRLRRLDVAPHLIRAEVEAMKPVIVAKTTDRSVLGILVDYAKMMPYYAERWDEAGFRAAESLLSETPCYAGRPFEQVIFPRRKTPELLRERWDRSQ